MGEDGNADFQALLAAIRSCRHGAASLPLGPRPIVQLHPDAPVVIVSQAPGLRVHRTGIPFDDPSGDRLRSWLGVDRSVFYDARRIAILPMGFCYPGRGPRGDLPPRPECAPLWHPRVWAQLRRVRLVLLLGRHAIAHHLGRRFGHDLTATVRNWRRLPEPYLALPHPSPRNRPWLQANPWFETELLPALRARLHALFAGDG